MTSSAQNESQLEPSQVEAPVDERSCPSARDVRLGASSQNESGTAANTRFVDQSVDNDAASMCSSRARGLSEAVKMASERGDPKKKNSPFTLNIQALLTSAFLFTLITVIQVFAAKIAHSQALLMDCISMGVDALTYMGNIVVECFKRDGGEHVPAQLVVAAVSLSCLTYFTYDASMESWGTVQVCMGKAPAEGDDDDVNGYITLAFALGGVVFDGISLWAFWRSHRIDGSSRALNMFTALLHVGADCLRSISTTVMSLLILSGGFDSTCLDAYVSLLIGASIICGGIFGLVNWMKMLSKFLRGKA